MTKIGIPFKGIRKIALIFQIIRLNNRINRKLKLLTSAGVFGAFSGGILLALLNNKNRHGSEYDIGGDKLHIKDIILSLFNSYISDWSLSIKVSENNKWKLPKTSLFNIISKKEISQPNCSNSTQVSLALKKNTAENCLKPLKILNELDGTLETYITSFLSSLHTNNPICTNSIKKLLSKKRPSGDQPEFLIFGDFTHENDLKYKDTELYFYLRCLETILIISQNPEDVFTLVPLGIEVLQRIFMEYPNNITVKRSIARILSNISMDSKFSDLISEQGFLSLLSQWMKSEDLALNLHSAKCLRNMEENKIKYSDGVYLCHPYFDNDNSKRQDALVDIVFIHGLRGGPFRTWRQKDSKISTCKCWPKDWLAVDVENIRVLSVEYPSTLTTWYSNSNESLQERAKVLAEKLKIAGIGQRPIIWLGHSMGGLIIKAILNEEETFLEKSNGILFYSVPHKGSPLASISSTVLANIFYISNEVKELQQGCSNLIELNKNFLNTLLKKAIPIYSFAEGSPSLLLFGIKKVIVPPECCDFGFGELTIMPELNHLDICKPESKESKIYVMTLQFIKSCLSVNEYDKNFHYEEILLTSPF